MLDYLRSFKNIEKAFCLDIYNNNKLVLYKDVKHEIIELQTGKLLPLFYKHIKLLDIMLGFISSHRFQDTKEFFLIGLIIYNETNGDDLGLLLWLKYIRIHQSYFRFYNKFMNLYKDYKNCTIDVSIYTIIYLAALDSPEEFQAFCDEFDFHSFQLENDLNDPNNEDENEDEFEEDDEEEIVDLI